MTEFLESNDYISQVKKRHLARKIESRFDGKIKLISVLVDIDEDDGSVNLEVVFRIRGKNYDSFFKTEPFDDHQEIIINASKSVRLIPAIIDVIESNLKD